MYKNFELIKSNSISKQEELKKIQEQKRAKLKKIYEYIIFDNDMQKLNLYSKNIETIILIGIKYYAKFGIEILKKLRDTYKEDKNLERYKRQIDTITNNAILLDICCASLTILTFKNLFPISKFYSGNRYQIKDYFYTLDYIDKLGIDENKDMIGFDKIDEFCMEYVNKDIAGYNIFKMLLLNDIQVLNGEETIFEKFIKKNGISVLKKIEKGIFYNSQTQEIYREAKNDIDYSGRRHLKLVKK